MSTSVYICSAGNGVWCMHVILPKLSCFITGMHLEAVQALRWFVPGWSGVGQAIQLVPQMATL